MAQDAEEYVIISDLSGGRNGIDSPTSDEFPSDQCVEAVNMDFRNGGLGRRRGGSVNVVGVISGSGLGAAQIRSIFHHSPSDAATAWEMWMFDLNNVIARLPVGTVCSPPGYVPDLFYSASAGATGITAVSFNGKLFLFYLDAGGQNKNKVFDPPLGIIRYVGLSTPAAPTVANTGVGAYAAVLRSYRVRFIQLNGAVVVSRSEPSPTVTFTPSGVGTAARVTKPANPTFSTVTHWEVEGSIDGINFYVLAGAIPGSAVPAIPVATASFDDTVVVATYVSRILSHPAGVYKIPDRAKFAVTDGNRLITGNLPGIGRGSRVMWTPVLGSLDQGDDERIFETSTLRSYLDLNTGNGGELSGMGQINGVIYPFKMRETWRLTPTSSLESPYLARRLSRTAGCVAHKAIAEGEYEDGNPCLYFMSHRGPYRVGSRGVEYIGRDIEDATRMLAGSPNINTNATVIAHSVYHTDVGQWWLWFATGNNTFPDRLFVLDTKRAVRRDRHGIRGGWTEITGPLASATCSAMGPYALIPTVNFRPWVGTQTNGKVLVADRDDIMSDDGTVFLARIKTRSIFKFGRFIKLGEVTGIVRHGSSDPGGLELQLTSDPDYGQGQPRTFTAFANPVTDVLLPIRWHDAAEADAISIQLQIAEATAQAGYWEVIQLKANYSVKGEI